MDKQYYIDNHIGVFKNFMPNEMIDSYLNYFNKCEQQGAVYPRREDEMLVSDNAIDTIRDTNVPMTYNNKPFIAHIIERTYMLKVKPKYSAIYPTITGPKINPANITIGLPKPPAKVQIIQNDTNSIARSNKLDCFSSKK